MQTIKVKLRFVTPCLGQIRCSDYDRFQRDGDSVIFMEIWWTSILDYGARALGRHHKDIADIHVDPRIEGLPKRFKRFYREHEFKEHEAYLPGDVIGATFMVPSAISEKDFLQILTYAGRFCGISPYGWKKGFGKFEVVEPNVS
jgi:hypothetical protein